MTFYNHIESVRGIAIDLTNGRKWRGASDKAAVFDALDAARREYMRLSDDNAKLRELAAGIGHLLFTLDVDYCAICPRDDINHPCPVHTVEGGDCLYETDLRELGVEVDE